MGEVATPTWENSLDFSRRVRPLWRNFIQDYFINTELIDKEDDSRYQSAGWDYLIVFPRAPPLRVEVKTRTERIYKKYFLKDQAFAIETKANLEAEKIGSSIYGSEAELWAYGYAKKDLSGLLDAWIFWREAFTRWLRGHEQELRRVRSSTDDLYHTECVLVPLHVIELFLVERNYAEAVSA